MPRDIPVGNGSLLVNFDSNYDLRDLYWPHVGQENHTVGHPCRLGAWVDGEFSWVSDAKSRRSLDCAHDKLVTEVKPEHPYTNEPLSVSPLTWSHATLVLTVHEYLQRQKVIRQAQQASGGVR